MKKIEDLEKEIKLIKDRNKRVESDKAWETSWTRKTLLALFTYLAISIYMYSISLPNPWLNAIVPSIGFLLSTLTLPTFKNLWKKHIYGN
ncbi:hypothetical protein A3D05_05790 [Candidatus Gottesmanbacteria bacterium RIFCSPHIGHO2_02_FULL_40_24]|uniref:2TM domain-containing protein n=1 Tax=Candidatus Gottesmanbacteria bacterium RIFCSPHIGHO2_01_FULL_40_15 TaxID=1798376 RepID=A0A1F5Z7R0_9BACT|nr:MAG: hypothetical protein A2777_02425 [Candidatus Gottesmanbacteria bacterium RIFCSPHIGHO2_01_FULL_40_15]OGG16539.1 MAG: hypothetical protein A3D05_05790 [Candidatus Gottesmanbacteria bacterium RIFCSPHIGHO2_02_FULL_40_24]OGG22616.1 MAG: hypothetical protein A3B48_02270 [Candidatus Gottesmanbacteria bacterium RIFCSPLOWO2_01_FULL_40_10]OGG25653.1 MAG: hypothetical protein A3E42_04945 [Candidatus Gottesmanbacteria bacterium RIFCSPHIGHO2_12_FULL_40_13]OGG32654.1 MAG: hypothetical protein A3I80_0